MARFKDSNSTSSLKISHMGHKLQSQVQFQFCPSGGARVIKVVAHNLVKMIMS